MTNSIMKELEQLRKEVIKIEKNGDIWIPMETGIKIVFLLERLAGVLHGRVKRGSL